MAAYEEIRQPDRLPDVAVRALQYGELSLEDIGEAVELRTLARVRPYAGLLVESGVLAEYTWRTEGRRSEVVYTPTRYAERVAFAAQREPTEALWRILYRLPLFRRYADLQTLRWLTAVYLQQPHHQAWVQETLLALPALAAVANGFLAQVADAQGLLSDERSAQAQNAAWRAALIANGEQAEAGTTLRGEWRFRAWEKALGIATSDLKEVADDWLTRWRWTADEPVHVPATVIPCPQSAADFARQQDGFFSLLWANQQREVEGLALSLPHFAAYLGLSRNEVKLILAHWEALGMPLLTQDDQAILLRPVEVVLPAGQARQVQDRARTLGLLTAETDIDVQAETFSGASMVTAIEHPSPISASFLDDLRARLLGQGPRQPYTIHQPPGLERLTEEPDGFRRRLATSYGSLPLSDQPLGQSESYPFVGHQHLQHLPHACLAMLLAEWEHNRGRLTGYRLARRRGQYRLLTSDEKQSRELASALDTLLEALGYRVLPTPGQSQDRGQIILALPQAWGILHSFASLTADYQRLRVDDDGAAWRRDTQGLGQALERLIEEVLWTR